MKPKPMRPVQCIFIALTFIIACQSAENNKPKANFHLPFRKDSLAGNWMIIRLSLPGNDRPSVELEDSVITPLKEKIVLTAFSFQPAGSVVIDAGKVARTGGNWQMNSTKQLYITQKDTSVLSTPLFNIMRYRNDSLTLENVVKVKNENYAIRYIVKRLRSNDSVPDLFDPALNKWRDKPAQAEDDAAIKSRLKQVLYYYSAYFANISGNKIPVFNTEKIFCPIKFYSGGIGMKKFKADDGWTNVFFDKKDAKKAHEMLDNAFTNIQGYPDKGGDYVSEYVIALKLVADLL
jgi:hypothetical protein